MSLSAPSDLVQAYKSSQVHRLTWLQLAA